jgi:hypothetical protein
MPIAEQFHAATAAARNFPALEEISRTLWQAHAAGALSDDAAQGLAETLQARKAALAGRSSQVAQKRAHAARTPCRSPDRAKSIRRRRAVAMSGAIPAKLAANFTQAETAALSVIAREAQRQGRCDLPIDAVAAMAGCSRTVVQSALRQARSIWLVQVQERPQPGRKHLTNVVTIISPEWLSWLKIGNDRVNFSERHEYQIFNSYKKTQAPQKTHLRSAALGGISRKRSHGIKKCSMKPKF